MAKKKKIEETVEEKITFDDKTIADVYEAQICLALKLDTLISLMEKVVAAAEKKANGTNTYM